MSTMDADKRVKIGDVVVNSQPSEPVIAGTRGPRQSSESASYSAKFEELAGSIFHHCNEALNYDGDAFDVPQYPIAENQQKGHIVREISKRTFNKSYYSQEGSHGLTIAGDGMVLPTIADELKNEDYSEDLVPSFQRIAVSGEEMSGVPLEDLHEASEILIRALLIREKYMAGSMQSFPSMTARFLRRVGENSAEVPVSILPATAEFSTDLKTLQDHPMDAPSEAANPFVCDLPPAAGYQLQMIDGVMHIFSDAGKKLMFGPRHTIEEFIGDQNMLFTLIADGPLKSFCYRRLNYLSAKYELHTLLNELRESASQRQVPHRDRKSVV